MAGDITTSQFLRNISCTKCGAPITIRAAGLSKVVGCPGCKSVLDADSEDAKILSKGQRGLTRTMCIPLGSRGKIHGVVWEVIGYMERSDLGSFSWSEYLLFNPTKGFRFLVESDWHWSFVVALKAKPKSEGFGKDRDAKYGTNSYKLFHRGQARIEYILGEFYWEAKINDTVAVEDYVNHNEILSREVSKDEETWSIGEYFSAENVKAVFKLKNLPSPHGIAPNQPNELSLAIKPIWKTWFLAASVLFALQVAFMVSSLNKTIFEEEGIHSEAFPNPVARKITIPKDTGNLQVIFSTSVENSWLELDGEFADADGNSEEFDVGTEFYSGYDGGERWTEGDRKNDRVLSHVAGGEYQFNFRVSGDRAANYKVTVKRDVTIWSMFLFVLFALTLWPVYFYLRERSFQVKKWSQSDYSPYAQFDLE